MGEKERTEEAVRAASDLRWQEWKEIAGATHRRSQEHNQPIIAAGVAFYATLALVPGITAMILGYTLLAGTDRISRHLSYLEEIMPEQVHSLLSDQIDVILAASGTAMSLILILSLLFAILSARSAILALIAGLNRAKGVDDDQRSGVAHVVRTLLMTFGAILFLLATIAIAVLLPLLLGVLWEESLVADIIGVIRWVVLLLLVLFAVSMLYRYGPGTEEARWRFAGVGSLIAGTVWVAASVIFAWYVETVGGYNQMYGTLGGAVILMIWLYISALVLLSGAEVDDEIARVIEEGDGRTAKRSGGA